jgi:hypothetical protein
MCIAPDDSNIDFVHWDVKLMLLVLNSRSNVFVGGKERTLVSTFCLHGSITYQFKNEKDESIGMISVIHVNVHFDCAHWLIQI